MRRKGLVLAGLLVLLVSIVFVYVNNRKPAPSSPASTEGWDGAGRVSHRRASPRQRAGRCG